MNALEFRDVDILFPRERGRAGERAVQAALAKLDAGATREEIAESLGVVVGVAGASLSIEPGEICVMMGLSGSGKSTLMRAANGLNAVTRGQVLVNDAGGAIDVGRCSAEDLRRLRRGRVAMVFQQFGLLPWRTVAENVGFGLEIRGEPPAARRENVARQLELVGLSPWADRDVGELSGGMQQRVGLARAFATDADILLMDEPFSALDPLIRDKLQDELLAVQARVKKTILFVSHDLDEALRLGDRISIMRHGRIVQTGAAQDIVLRPADDYVAEFVRRMNPLKVLTGAMVMRAREALAGEGGALWLDPARRYALRDGGALELRLDGAAHPIRQLDDEDACLEGERALVAVPAGITLQGLIHIRRRTGHPVLLVEDGRVVGVAGEAEIIGALSARAGSGAA
ncbi:MAG TPA: choline ABC transporter ATP-binding protein [Steroidobacteraceae bacterium]|nr:choline ABC transporter ATP-binding protein [Steroidobacteraceae bacterium]